MEERLPRKLAAVLYADVAGYSRLTGEDEEGTHLRLGECLNRFAEAVAEHNGRVVHYAGDAILADFNTVTEAVACALVVQSNLGVYNADLPEERRIEFRIGINLGEVIVDRADLYGDGVNVAARLEALAEPGGICISDSVRTSLGNRLALDYDDLGEQQVKNIVEPVRAFRVEVPRTGRPDLESGATTRPAASIVPDRVSLTLPERPSIAVLPFTNMSDDPTQDYFSDGITEDIITNLASFENLFVIARNSSFAFKNKNVDVRQIGTDLGVRFVLEGSLRKSGNRIRVTAQLIDAASGEHLWAQRYDRDLEDVFAVQDEITAEIAQELEVKLLYGEQARAWRRGTRNVEAYDLALQGRDLWRRFRAAELDKGRQLVERALELDPSFAYAMVLLGYHCITKGLSESAATEGAWFDRALELGSRALSVDPTLGDAHAMLCQAHRYNREYDRALEHGQIAVTLSPDSADANMYYSGILASIGRGDEAMDRMEVALRLNPFPQAMCLRFLGAALMSVRRFADAIAAFRECISHVPNMISPQIGLTLALMEAGDIESARAQAAEVIRVLPEFSASENSYVSGYRDPETRAHYTSLLRQAGLPG